MTRQQDRLYAVDKSLPLSQHVRRSHSQSCTLYGARRFVIESPHGVRIVFDWRMANDSATIKGAHK
jgi:hypothetical protein